MSLGENAFDELAYALVETEFDFDAVERGRYRAEWIEDGTKVVVSTRDTDETRTYGADELVIATSDREVRNARQGTGSGNG